MFAKSLVIFVIVGVVSGFIFGSYLLEVKNTSEVIYTEGVSLSVIPEKYDYKKGDSIRITVINSGTVPLYFPNSSFGFKITGLSGMLIYSPPLPTVSSLDPKEETEFVWNQTKNDGGQALEGLYKIHAIGLDDDKKKIEKSVTVSIWK